MGTDASGDTASPSEEDPGGIAGALARTSERIRELTDAVKPEDPDRVGRVVKFLLSVLFTAMFVYWILAYQFDVVWFEF
ncbi:hypothetical protein DQW50_11645 [Halorubrum sp. 48-1-W]|uniref:hypothetical protein n=1 Tax=Halorubrum sp. 48-1-W TaxID=2249761 RepID=UPI000DCD2D8A|nr:hypothetical protein [Halorubrum sp. 48-1-W]RAW44964.1 hypothetical protein DQW50_11645 [Halorubrum sp. 48-1-W]